MPNEPIQQGPYPSPSNPPDGPNQMGAIVAWAAERTAMRFASTTVRDAAIPNPVPGMVCYTGTGSTGRWWIYHDGNWRALPIPQTGTIAPYGPNQNWWTRDLVWIKNGSSVTLCGRVLRQTSNLDGSSRAYQLPPELSPLTQWNTTALQQRTTARTVGTAEIHPDGAVNIVASDPNFPIIATWSVHFNITYPVAG